MNDFKKTFLAGLCVFVVLMLTPYYLQLIGYGGVDSVGDSESVVPESLEFQPVTSEREEEQFDILKLSETSLKSPLNKQQTFKIQTNNYSALFSSVGGGSFLSYNLDGSRYSQFKGGYNESGIYSDTASVSLILDNQKTCAPCVALVYGGERRVLDVPFSLISSVPEINNLFDDDSVRISMEYSTNNFKITKTTTFYANSYKTYHTVDLVDYGGGFESVSLVWDKGIRNTEKNLADEITFSTVSVSNSSEIESFSFSPSHIEEVLENSSFLGSIEWAALRNKYFIMAFVPEVARFASLGSTSYQLGDGTFVPCFQVEVGSSVGGQKHQSELVIGELADGAPALGSVLYLGPLDIDYINDLQTTLDRIMNFGWYIIQPFSRGVLWLLKSMHGLGLNYGIVLILFAFLIRIITGPLTKKSFLSSQKMQAIQPKLKSLQEKYKKDPQRLNKETVNLYKESGVNPLGGCLPMLLQMPLLFSLFLVFRSTIEFRGASFFGWISNLSQPDTIIELPFYIPIYGDQIALLPILLGVSMFLTQRLSMATMDSQQKPIMYIMSVFFFLIFNSFPSGLNLYYLCYNTLNYFQQKSLKKS